MLQMNGTPLGMAVLRFKKVAAPSETKQACPVREEEMNQVIRSRTDWRERVVFRLAWITASRWFEIAVFTPNNFKLEPDGTLVFGLGRGAETARADPHCFLRFVRARGQDALDTITLCGTLRRNEELTNLTNAHVERALALWGATAHSIKRGALRHAAPIMETYNLDPHVVSQLTKHFDSFYLSKNTVRYSGK
ncbi:putative trans-sialidase [Trypanosoma cruzi]|nr:putative trans-sialidase [Trypanosoma cruzi]